MAALNAASPTPSGEFYEPSSRFTRFAEIGANRAQLYSGKSLGLKRTQGSLVFSCIPVSNFPARILFRAPSVIPGQAFSK